MVNSPVSQVFANPADDPRSFWIADSCLAALLARIHHHIVRRGVLTLFPVISYFMGWIQAVVRRGSQPQLVLIKTIRKRKIKRQLLRGFGPEVKNSLGTTGCRHVVA